MFRTWIVGLVAGLACVAAAAARGQQVPGSISVPPPPGIYQYTALATDAQGALYACDGDAVWRLQGSTFTQAYSGIAAVADAWVDPSGFAVNAAGTLAYVATGYSGRIVEIDLADHTARELDGARGAWVYGNYGVAVDPVAGTVFLTDSLNQDLYRVNPAGSGSLSLLKHFNGEYGGGIAFTPTGELIVPVAVGRAAYPTDDNFPIDLYRFPRSYLDAVAGGQTPAGDPVPYAQGLQVSGTGFVAADEWGAVYIEGLDAIYKVDAQGNLTTFYGDPSLNVFDKNMAGIGLMGLAYDAVGERLLFAYRATDSEDWKLYEATPEPMTLGLVAAGLAGLWVRRRARR
jgi:DNA-binding beta-propeller fold protein YncE